jgi:hypothetical protein
MGGDEAKDEWTGAENILFIINFHLSKTYQYLTQIALRNYPNEFKG